MEYRGYVRTPATEEFTWPDLPMLRSIVASTARTKEQKSQIKALLQKHGITKLSELPLSDYHAFLEEVEAMV